MSRIDHIVFGVRDLDAAARALWKQHGLEALPGGEHSGAGTANMIVPLGNDQFIELLAVTDSTSRHPIVRWLSGNVAHGDRLLLVAVEPDDFEACAARLREPVMENHRDGPDGRRVGFRLTGISGAFGPDLLPFFVETTSGREWRCGTRSARHRVEPHGVRWVEIGSEESKVRGWIGDTTLPFVYARGRPGVSAIGLDMGGREVILRA